MGFALTIFALWLSDQTIYISVWPTPQSNHFGAVTKHQRFGRTCGLQFC